MPGITVWEAYFVCMRAATVGDQLQEAVATAAAATCALKQLCNNQSRDSADPQHLLRCYQA
jgi:hypothetical protein